MNEIHVHLELLEGDATAGVWCDSCLLPSVVEMPFIEAMNGVPVRAFIVSQCQECEREWGWP